MKTTILKYITVTFAAGAMLLAGCNDLDQEPTNKFTDKAFWTSPERANMVLNMAYNQMFGHDKIWQDEALSDNLYEQRGNPDTRTIRMGQATPNTGLFRSEWKWVFEGVKTCNVFMNFVDEVPGMDPERLAGMKAQIRFTSAAEYNSEVILDYAAVELNKQWSTLYSMVPLTMGANLCQKAPTRALVDSYLNADGSVPADKTVYANRDPRLTATVVYNGYVWKDRNDKGEYVTKGTINVTSGNDKAGTDNGSPTGFYTRKYFDTTHGKNLEMWTNIIMMRYADVLLMYAEAKAYLNEMDAAVWNETIKPIRQRAGLSGTDFPSSGDYTQIVRDERRVELALEGLRYFDLIRWINYKDSKSQGVIDLLNGAVYGAKELNGGRQIDEFKFNSSRDILWSLPLSETQLVPTLLPNNSGY